MKKSKVISLLRVVVSAVLIYLLYGRLDLPGLALRLQGVLWAPMVLFFVLLFFNSVISAAKWRILLHADATDVPFRTLLGSYLVGTFFNVFLPSNIGGDAYRIYDIAKRSARPVNTFASVFADRLSGFIALAVLGLCFPLLGYGLLDRHRMLLLPLAVFVALGGVVWLLFQQGVIRRVLSMPPLNRFERLSRTAEKFLASIDVYRRRPGLMTKVMAVSFLFQFTVIVAVFLLSVALGLRVPFFYFCVFVPLISLLEAMPLSIYGVGLRDSGYVFFLTQVGHSREEAAAMSVLYVAATLIYSSVGGVIFLLKRDAARAAAQAGEKAG